MDKNIGRFKHGDFDQYQREMDEVSQIAKEKKVADDKLRLSKMHPIVETDSGANSVQVYRDDDGVYHVVRDEEIKHPDCTAEDAMRVLATYLQSALYMKNKVM